MTILPPAFLRASRGSFPAGRICREVPKHRERSACLQTTHTETTDMNASSS